MQNQNVTLSVPKSLLKKAKILAAKKDKSLSELFRESLEEKINEDSGYRKAMSNQIKLLNRGFDLGTKGKVNAPREQRYARK